MILEGIVVGLVLSLVIAIRYIIYFKNFKKEKSEIIAGLERIIERKSNTIDLYEQEIQKLKKFNG